MRAICVDDERGTLEDTLSMCRELPQIDEAVGFSRAEEALAWLEENRADVALLDITLPGMSGLALAKRLRQRQPDTAVVFLTGYPQYAVDAFAVRALGYLLKPVNREKLSETLDYVRAVLSKRHRARTRIQTFGAFEVFVDGRPVEFRMARCKELLAYLVDKHGSSVKRPEAFAVLWEDRLYDRGMQKQLDVVIRSLRATLRDYGIEEIFELQSGSMRIRPETFTCDAYRFLEGDPESIGAFSGEYMRPYSWASLTENRMSRNWRGDG